MDNYSSEHIQQTIQVWQTYSDSPITENEAVKINDNLLDLLSFLEELHNKYEKETHL